MSQADEARELAAITCRGCKGGHVRVPFKDGSGALHQPHVYPSTDDYLCTSKADALLPILARHALEARKEALEEAAHFVETHWCENDMQNNYKVHERKPHPNEPLAKAIRSLAERASKGNAKAAAASPLCPCELCAYAR